MDDKIISPFENETEYMQIGGITIENRLDRVSVYGSLDITRDKEGLAAAKCLKALLDRALAILERAELPDKITLADTETVDNPFT